MATRDILSLSWEKYDSKKELVRQDKNVFCPEQLWEFDYLLDAIVMADPDVDIITVMLAIRKSMRETVAPRLRTKFVEAVMQGILDRENQLVKIIEGANKMAS